MRHSNGQIRDLETRTNTSQDEIFQYQEVRVREPTWFGGKTRPTASSSENVAVAETSYLILKFCHFTGEGLASFIEDNSANFSGESKVRWSFLGCRFFENTPKIFQSNLVLVVVLVLEAEDLQLDSRTRTRISFSVFAYSLKKSIPQLTLSFFPDQKGYLNWSREVKPSPDSIISELLTFDNLFSPQRRSR